MASEAIEVRLDNIKNRSALVQLVHEKGLNNSRAGGSKSKSRLQVTNRIPSSFKISNKNNIIRHIKRKTRWNALGEHSFDNQGMCTPHAFHQQISANFNMWLESPLATAASAAEKMRDQMTYEQRVQPILDDIESLREEEFKVSNGNAGDLSPQMINLYIKYFSNVRHEDAAKQMDRWQLRNRRSYHCDPEYPIIALSGSFCCSSCGAQISDESQYLLPINDKELKQTSFDHQSFAFVNNCKPKSSFQYLPSAHFNDRIAAMLGKKNHSVPNEVLCIVRNEAQKQHGNAALDEITRRDIRRILKKTGLVRYYDHDASILGILTGKQPARITPEAEKKIKSLYDQYNEAWAYVRGARKNRLSVGYTSRQLAILIGERDFAENFPLLKSQEKLAASDALWKRVCVHLNWPFYPTC